MSHRTQPIRFCRYSDQRQSLAGTTGTDGTTATFSILPGVLEGRLLLAAISADGNPTFSGWPTGWLPLVPYTANGTAIAGEVRYKVSDGTETSFDITMSAAENYNADIIVIDGHNCSEIAPVATVTTGTSAAPNPPSLTPPWAGNPATLWISGHMADDDHETAVWWPSGWLRGAFRESDTSGSDTCTLAYAIQHSGVVTNDPGAFALGSSAAWIAWTIAVPAGDEGIGTHAIPFSHKTSVNTATTTHTVLLPFDLEVGDKVVVAFGTDGAPTYTWPAGFTAVVADAANGASVKGGVREHNVDGTEGWTNGSTITITTSANEDSSACAMRIVGASTAIASEGGSNTATGTSPASNTFTPSAPGGNLPFLWLTGVFSDNTSPAAEPDWWQAGQIPISALRSSAGADAVMTAVSARTREVSAMEGRHRTTTSVNSVAWMAAIYPGPAEEEEDDTPLVSISPTGLVDRASEMLKQLKKLYTQDPKTDSALREIYNAIDPVIQLPILQGRFMDVSFPEGELTQKVIHKLGRKYQGYWVVQQTANVTLALANTSSTNPKFEFDLTASAACDVVLWVF